MPKKLCQAIADVMHKVHLGADGYPENMPQDDPARRLPPLTKEEYAYQLARKALIPVAAQDAEMWSSRSPESHEDKDATKMAQLAFSNSMQRQAFEAGLIGYDPTKCTTWVKEADLLALQQKRAKRRAERDAGAVAEAAA